MNFVNCALFVVVLFRLSCGQTANPLPTKFHAKVYVTEGTVSLTQQEQLDVTAVGDYYYDANASKTVFITTDAQSGRITREICLPNQGSRICYAIDTAANSCAVVPGLTKSSYFPPNFLTSLNFSFVRIEYLILPEPNVFYQTYHYQSVSPSNPFNTVDYWYQVETGTPFRFAFGAINPDIVQFQNVVSSLDDVENVDYIFSVPSYCNSLRSPKKGFDSRKSVAAKKPPVTGPVPSSHRWPIQFHCKSGFTGNDFGLSSGASKHVGGARGHKHGSLMDLGEPTYVGISLLGHYYYDWPNQRECNIWSDFHSNIRTKTMITNGHFYYIQLATGACTIVPFTPKGPLKPEWPTTLDYVDQQYVFKTPKSFIVSNMFGKDALNVGQAHNFSYWEDQITFTPLQFQGPVLDFYPYGQSMSVWSEFELGLGGLNLTDIFSFPANCGLTQPHKLAKEALMHYQFYKMRHALL